MLAGDFRSVKFLCSSVVKAIHVACDFHVDESSDL